MMNIVFLGSADFGMESIKAIHESSHNICLAILKPDKKKGRGQKLQESELKKWCVDRKIDIIQPEKIDNRTAELVSKIKPDLIVVVAFGEILKEEFYNIPKFRSINLHASLLPLYRGAAPIEWAIAKGEQKTGLTIQYIEKKMDSGDIIANTEMEINKNETSIELRQKMLALCGDFLIDTIDRIERKEIEPTPQDPSKVSYCRLIRKSDGNIDWKMTADTVVNQYRAFCNWPGLTTIFRGKRIKIKELAYSADNLKSTVPGEIISISKNEIKVACGEKAILIKVLQPENKKAMCVEAFINGYHPKQNEKFGEKL